MCDCFESSESICPFRSTEASEEAQNSGSVPTSWEMILVRFHDGKTAACLDNPDVPCSGALEWLRQHGFDYHIIDENLLQPGLFPGPEAKRRWPAITMDQACRIHPRFREWFRKWRPHNDMISISDIGLCADDPDYDPD